MRRRTARQPPCWPRCAPLLEAVASGARGSCICITLMLHQCRTRGPLLQVEAVARALPRAPVPADLLARQALHDAAAEAAAAAAPAAPDCLEACCLRDDLHLFMCAGGQEAARLHLRLGVAGIVRDQATVHSCSWAVDVLPPANTIRLPRCLPQARRPGPKPADMGAPAAAVAV